MVKFIIEKDKNIIEKVRKDLEGNDDKEEIMIKLKLHKSSGKIETMNVFNNTDALHLNQLCLIKIEGLEKLKDLKHLNLSNNELKEIDNLDKLTNLRTLNIENNQIEKLTRLDQLVNLQKLNIENNPINFIQVKKYGFYKIYDDAIIPTRATKYSAGYDLYSLKDYEISPSQKIRIQAGIYHVIPNNYVGKIYLRSGWSYDNLILIPNSVGIIDADYTGKNCELMFQLWYPKIEFEEYHKEYEKGYLQPNIIIKKGDRIGQIVYQEYKTFGEEVLNIRNSGLGSTGE